MTGLSTAAAGAVSLQQLLWRDARDMVDAEGLLHTSGHTAENPPSLEASGRRGGGGTDDARPSVGSGSERTGGAVPLHFTGSQNSLVRDGICSTAVVLRGFGKATKSLDAVRAALRAAEAGLPTPREVRDCSLVRLPKLVPPPSSSASASAAVTPTHAAGNASNSVSPTHAAASTRQRPAKGGGKHGGADAALLGPPPVGLDIYRALTRAAEPIPPLRESYYRVAVDSDDDNEAGANVFVFSPSAISGGPRRGSGLRISGRRASLASLGSPPSTRVGSPLALRPGADGGTGSPDSCLLVPHGLRRLQPVQAVLAARRGSDQSNASSSAYVRGSGFAASPRSLAQTMMPTPPAGTINAIDAADIIAEHHAVNSCAILREIEEKLKQRATQNAARTQIVEAKEANERLLHAVDAREFSQRLEVDCQAHDRRVELARRERAHRVAARNHTELAVRERLDYLTQLARRKAEAQAEEAARIAYLQAGSKYRLALGQIEGAETHARCRIHAEQTKAFNLIVTKKPRRG
jgi:hypothetical protein